ncbi:MAG: extracellular solute-binding protein [Synechococcaceae cyanobacterium]|nr:extracellular solute-binding protein [Synechococcaceae cyanobacterium]
MTPLPCRSGHPARALAVLLALAAALGGCAAPGGSQREIGVYSGRHYNTDKALYDAFTARTGIRVKLLEAKDDTLIERVRREGAASPADVLVLVDAARLDKATDLGLFRPTPSAALRRDVPPELRDSKGRWYGLTRRLRVVIVDPKQVDPASLRTYADLAAPALKGRLCLRDRRSVYNQSLVADQLIQRGEAATADWVRGMAANVTRPFFTSDMPLIRAVANGQCGVGVVNSYYVARMLSGRSGDADQTLARRLKVIFPDPVHVNISGAGVVRSSRNPTQAIRLIEFLASPSGGRGYAEANNEYPLRGSGDNPILRGFGRFRPASVSIEQMGAKNAEAVRLMESNGWR